MALRFRLARREDSGEIVTLLNETFRTPIDIATWEWYVYGNPLGNSQAYVATTADESEMIGVIAYAPIHLRLEGAVLVADYAHHLALKPEYRDTLSYIGILRYSLQAQAARGIKLAIGPPNRTAYPIHKALTKWVDFGFLDCLRKLAPAAHSHSCSELSGFSSDFDEFYRQASKNLALCVEKNTEWMNWRFSRRPSSPYTIFAASESGSLAGYVILKRWQDPDGYRKAHIVDLHALTESALRQVIGAAESYADGCNELNLWAVQHYPYRKALEEMGFAASFHQPLIARTYDRSPIEYPAGPASLSYGDGDTLY